MLLLTEGTWHQIPQTTMEMYKSPINDQLKTGVLQFVTKNDMQALWRFLSAFKRFLETLCKTPLYREPERVKLVNFLEFAEDMNEEMVEAFPKNIKLSQAGYAYYHAAKEYQKRSGDRKKQQGNF